MKLFFKIFLVVFVVLSFASTSMAQGENFAGVKSGIMMIDLEEFDNIIPIGIMYGHSLSGLVPNLWVEGEFNYGLSGGEAEYYGMKASIDLWTAAVYAAYRYPITDKGYLKGKLGILYESASIDYDFGIYDDYLDDYYVDSSSSDSEIGLSLGIGGGVKLNEKMAVEAEFTMIEADVNYLSVGLNYYF